MLFDGIVLKKLSTFLIVLPSENSSDKFFVISNECKCVPILSPQNETPLIGDIDIILGFNNLYFLLEFSFSIQFFNILMKALFISFTE